MEHIDANLVRRGAAGDQAALTVLYEKTHSGVWYCIKALIKDEDTALDVLQDSYLKAFGSLDQLQEPARFDAWICQIAHNRALDVLRQKRLISFSELETDEDSPLYEAEDTRAEHLPEVVVEQKETTRLLNEILDALPEEQRVVISLFYYDQLSVAEIAEELNVSENTVKSRLNYGRKKVETGVRALEKKGTKLYGLAPLPFLLLLFRSQAAYTAEIPAAVAKAISLGTASAGAASTAAVATAGTQAAAGTGAAAGAGAAAGKAAANVGKTAAKAVGHALRTKLLIGAAAATLAIGGGTAAYIHFSEPPAEPSRIVKTTKKEQILSDDFLRDMERLAASRHSILGSRSPGAEISRRLGRYRQHLSSLSRSGAPSGSCVYRDRRGDIFLSALPGRTEDLVRLARLERADQSAQTDSRGRRGLYPGYLPAQVPSAGRHYALRGQGFRLPLFLRIGGSVSCSAAGRHAIRIPRLL